ncbi:hypothetical protein F5884DRAFT_744835 [Xylogone sp. PMI_703]|nr:hypothetical protein F5884DRAFT_744835 [Xylogone sp. PMI_703]
MDIAQTPTDDQEEQWPLFLGLVVYAVPSIFLAPNGLIGEDSTEFIKVQGHLLVDFTTHLSLALNPSLLAVLPTNIEQEIMNKEDLIISLKERLEMKQNEALDIRGRGIETTSLESRLGALVCNTFSPMIREKSFWFHI